MDAYILISNGIDAGVGLLRACHHLRIQNAAATEWVEDEGADLSAPLA
jgi:hypothetical protein